MDRRRRQLQSKNCRPTEVQTEEIIDGHRWSSKVLRIGPTACNCLKLKFDDDPKPPNRHVCRAPLSARCSDRFSESRRTQETIVKAWTKSEIVPQRADFLMERRGFKLIVIVA